MRPPTGGGEDGGLSTGSGCKLLSDNSLQDLHNTCASLADLIIIILCMHKIMQELVNYARTVVFESE